MALLTHKIDSIQALRAIAVILVVYTHSIDYSADIFGTSRQASFYYLANWGAIGLDLFFVISGFIMTRIIKSYQHNDGWRLFAGKRALRIVPLYWGISLIAGLLIMRTYPIRFATILKTVVFFPIVESTFEFPIIGVGWSLSYEIYFYSLITILLLINVKKIELSVFFLLILLSLVGVLSDSPVVLIRFLTSPLLFEFALGIGCGLIYDKLPVTSTLCRWSGLLFMVGLLGMVSSVFWQYGDLSEAGSVTQSNYLAYLRGIIWGIPCALFLLGSTLAERTYSFSIPSSLVRIGDASYANYLLHGLLISFGRTTFLKLNLSADSYILFLVVFCTVGSLFVYQFVEKPMTKKLTTYFFPKRLGIARLAS
ncbi:acyltransferase family protein [Fibrella arboris]|uniref:acyltransferase family protein n=1 Tax=Fibrella arboris TaxID=3242486 RepID=UPI003522B18D